ncbi:MAG TPA: M48 family metallopeptidase [Gemmatimonadaceae bacterium]|nr:M48 family metallopeptidase [Gemmatimonadaceae bacterium]
MCFARRRRIAVILTAIVLSGCAISHRDEVRMGEEYAQQIESELPIVRDPETNRYLTVLGDSLARLVDTRSLAWRFVLVDSREVNAFALPGGFVYVTRGLVERTIQMDQLAGVLAHEIAHVTHRHAVEQLEKAQTASVGVTLVCILTGVCESPLARAGIDIGGAAVFAHHSREDEREADAEAVRTLVRAGIHPSGMIELLETLLAERERRPDALEAWFSTHPTEEERIANARQLVAAIDSAVLATLTMNSPRFQAFRDRLASLPPVASMRP